MVCFGYHSCCFLLANCDLVDANYCVVTTHSFTDIYKIPTSNFKLIKSVENADKNLSTTFATETPFKILKVKSLIMARIVILIRYYTDSK